MRVRIFALIAFALLSGEARAGDAGVDLRKLARAYPDAVASVSGDELTMRSGARIRYANGGEGRSFEERLASASLMDQMSIPYPKGRVFDVPGGDNDPGRLRNIPFFAAMYGTSEAEVRARLVRVRWLGRQEVLVTSVNGVDKALARVSEALLRLSPEVLACAHPSAGTFVYRPVAGTGYLSAHSFGIAIDLNLQCSDYWLWDQRRGAFAYKNRLPLEIVEAFEREGFIWGGKWAHYDTMHFEYRPELLVE